MTDASSTEVDLPQVFGKLTASGKTDLRAAISTYKTAIERGTVRPDTASGNLRKALANQHTTLEHSVVEARASLHEVRSRAEQSRRKVAQLDASLADAHTVEGAEAIVADLEHDRDAATDQQRDDEQLLADLSAQVSDLEDQVRAFGYFRQQLENHARGFELKYAVAQSQANAAQSLAVADLLREEFSPVFDTVLDHKRFGKEDTTRDISARGQLNILKSLRRGR